MIQFEGQLRGDGLRIGIVVSRFNDTITRRLLAGAHDMLVRHGVAADDVAVAWVPGAVEIPVVAQAMARSGAYDAVLTLGAVIRGATSHYETVCSVVASGVGRVALETGVPVIFGVLTTDTIEQALERSGTKAGNKGSEAAVAGIEMASLMQQLAG